MNDLTLTNARLVLPEEVTSGTVHVAGGSIAAVDTSPAASGEDMEGDYVIPGLVELHTDHLEGHYAPRPGVRWNPIAAAQAHDAQVAASGITTVFDALRLGTSTDSGDFSDEDTRRLADALDESITSGRLRADHLLHVRCEVSAAECYESFQWFADHHRLRLASLMDHAPGQRQFASLDAYAAYYQGKLKMSDEDFARFCTARLEASAANSDRNREAISAACRERGVVVASHDDATLAHVEESIEQGARVAEFPTTSAAAQAAHEAGLAVLMGAPNLIRGGSHSGNVSAGELVEKRHLDILSSDYIPFSLIQAAFHLGAMENDVLLPEAVSYVSRNPARAVGLDDRGEIAVGQRGDLVRVRVDGEVPIVRAVWREGHRVV